jgi:transposase
VLYWLFHKGIKLKNLAIERRNKMQAKVMESARVVWEAVLERCCGLDVHQQTITACLLIGVLDQQPNESLCSFPTTTKGLLELRDGLEQNGCTHVAIESTGIYWRPVFHILEDAVTVLLVNPYHMKQIPGRKTDLKDAQWIARLLRWGLLKPSLIPPKPIRELRELCRYRKKLTEQASAEKNRIQKVLEDANIKLASVASDIFGLSGRAMLDALLGGDMSPEEMAELARGKMRSKIPQLVDALEGRLGEHHCFLIRMHLEHLGYLQQAIAQLHQRIDEKIKPYHNQIELICSTPGFSVTSAQHVFVEIGGDISLFPSEGHLASWAGLCPGNNESAGKRKSGRTNKGNRWLRGALVQTAHAASRTKGTYLKSFYHRVAARRGKNRAAVAVARKQLASIYGELQHDRTYQELGENYFDLLNQNALEKRLVQRLQGLGYRVQLQPQTAL